MNEYQVVIRKSKDDGNYSALLYLVRRFRDEVIRFPVPGSKYVRQLTGIFAHPRYWFLPLEKRVEMATVELMAMAPQGEEDESAVEVLNLRASHLSKRFERVPR